MFFKLLVFIGWKKFNVLTFIGHLKNFICFRSRKTKPMRIEKDLL